ncbi:hypothetical protein ACI2IX_19920 [Leifsonia aquatica]|uniref:hypothetical protein n=1 Tax=Leifsonia aquatica TaxID=144185 RepID=UPI00384AAA38
MPEYTVTYDFGISATTDVVADDEERAEEIARARVEDTLQTYTREVRVLGDLDGVEAEIHLYGEEAVTPSVAPRVASGVDVAAAVEVVLGTRWPDGSRVDNLTRLTAGMIVNQLIGEGFITARNVEESFNG